MPPTTAEKIDALTQLTTGELIDRYAELFGQPVRTRHRGYLLRKLAWRIQALAEGDLTQRARHRAEELACDADVRLMPPPAPKYRVVAAPPVPPSSRNGTDPRLPAPGTALVRQYKGQTIRVVVEADGFTHQGQHYKSLTAIAQVVTGSHVNGFRFFRIGGKP